MTQTFKTDRKDPAWWTDKHTSAWERSKDALRRDWEQTKADVKQGGHELNQNAADTVKQSAGSEPIPAGNLPNVHSDSWDNDAPAVRYGHGARQHYGNQPWNDELETKLRKDWDSSADTSVWERVKSAVRRGWDSFVS